jgi:hypothetical protein
MACLFSVDKRHPFGYINILAPLKDMPRRHTVSWERGRCPRAGLQPAPGRLGYQSPGIMTGTGGASLDWDRRRRVTPVRTASQEAWPEADLGDEILSEMRTVVERRQACALQKGARRIARYGGW